MNYIFPISLSICEIEKDPEDSKIKKENWFLFSY